MLDNASQTVGLKDVFHPFDEMGTWIAFGKSAYAAKIIAEREKLLYLETWNFEPNQPSIKVTENVYQKLLTFNGEKVNEDDYTQWSEDLYHATIARKKKNTYSDQKYIKDNMSGFSRNTKRLIDLFASGFCLLCFFWLFVIIWFLVKREDHGPAIYSQERIGRFGRPFMMYKFRSMQVDAEINGPQLSHSSGEEDPRLTKIGKFIRTYHLDELPQLWNVFCGDMAFIGPRPERKYYIDQIMEWDSRYPLLYQIRPGVTSYATLYNGYTDTMDKMLRRLELDLYYLEHRSFWFDLKILWKTFCSIAFGKKF